VPSQWRHHGPRAEQLEELTDRERVVVALVAMGLNNTEIAEQLVISPATAKTHVSHAMLKLGAHHRAQLVVMAYESGLVQPSASAPSPRDTPMATAQPLERTAVNY
jgi:DNA-binding NarL/FixJ family response regulator